MALVMSLGYIMSFIPWYYYPSAIVLMWILSDGIQNKLKRNKFWTVNIYSKDIFMPISMGYVKVPLLFLTALLIIIYYPFK